MSLHNRIEHTSMSESEKLNHRYQELDQKVRRWPRTPDNDRFYYGALNIAETLSKETGLNVIIGFNEFGTPALADALDQAVKRGARKIIVITPMLTQGGEHAEKDIPAVIKQAQINNPHVTFQYCWPFQPADIAGFLSQQINRFI